MKKLFVAVMLAAMLVLPAVEAACEDCQVSVGLYPQSEALGLQNAIYGIGHNFTFSWPHGPLTFCGSGCYNAGRWCVYSYHGVCMFHACSTCCWHNSATSCSLSCNTHYC